MKEEPERIFDVENENEDKEAAERILLLRKQQQCDLAARVVDNDQRRNVG